MKPLCYDYLNCPTTFSTYDDFNKKFRITRPESFNFAYDVADRIRRNPTGWPCFGRTKPVPASVIPLDS